MTAYEMRISDWSSDVCSSDLSNGRFLRSVRKRTPYNPAFMHSADLAARGIAAGDLIEIVSAHGRVSAIAAVDDAVKPGVVSLAHGWGALPGSNEDPAVTGTAVNALIDTARRSEEHTSELQSLMRTSNADFC